MLNLYLVLSICNCIKAHVYLRVLFCEDAEKLQTKLSLAQGHKLSLQVLFHKQVNHLPCSHVLPVNIASSWSL